MPRTIITCATVFLLCLATGLLSGALFRTNQKPAEAASANITVTNNNQVSTIDQGTPTIQRTSTVTVKDATATLGYTLAARIENNSIPNSTVTIYSAASTTCTQASPCILTSDPTPTTILETTTANATQTDGDTTDWTVTITLPGATAQGNYILDIAYTEDPKFSMCPVIAGKTYMQDVTSATASNHSVLDRERVVLKDRRNNQDYYVQNIVNQDGSCLAWMETNLRYAGDGNYSSAWGYDDDRYATTTALAANTQSQNDDIRPLTTTTSGYLGGSSTTQYTYAGYFDPNGSTDYTNTAASGGFYGYLYTWCAAMGGQANACNNTSTSGFDTTQSICPAGWRLPTGGSGGEYRALNTAINTGSISSDAGLRTNFLAVYSGYYASGLTGQGSDGYYWSSTGSSGTRAYDLYFYSGYVAPGTSTVNKYLGQAARCVLV